MWVMAVVGVAPCQCRLWQGHQMMSPARISVLGPPSHWVQPTPSVTMRVWPRGCVCQWVRAPGWKVTIPLDAALGEYYTQAINASAPDPAAAP